MMGFSCRKFLSLVLTHVSIRWKKKKKDIRRRRRISEEGEGKIGEEEQAKEKEEEDDYHHQQQQQQCTITKRLEVEGRKTNQLNRNDNVTKLMHN